MISDQINVVGGHAMGVELVVYDTGTKGTGTPTQTMYAAIAPDYVNVARLASNLYKSTDGGGSWAAVSTPVSGYHIPHIVRAADASFYLLFTKGAGPGDGGSVAANLRANPFGATSLAMNPNVEGDPWLADGNTVYHSVDSGASWTKLNNFASIWGDDGGATWTRFNDEAHQFGGPGVMAADQNTYGRIYLGGSCRRGAVQQLNRGCRNVFVGVAPKPWGRLLHNARDRRRQPAEHLH